MYRRGNRIYPWVPGQGLLILFVFAASLNHVHERMPDIRELILAIIVFALSMAVSVSWEKSSDE